MYSSLAEFVVTYNSESPTDSINLVQLKDSMPAINIEPNIKTRTGEEPHMKSIFPSVNFTGLYTINPDIAAWLICEGTPVNYPIVQGGDNSFYLNHLFNGNQDKAGCLFIDRNSTPDFTDNNTVIYGHNMKNKSMFAALVEYKKQSFYDSHPNMLLLTPDDNYVIEIFAGYVTNSDDISWELRFNDLDDFSDWIANVRNKSIFTSDAVVMASAHIVTLSTCSYEFDDARFVLHGKLVS